ncbi:MAG: hypothetical protein J5945_01250 [Candidatus Methanomethylophilus sp.]|nr:hypothetical protein [Methanomethylophilus sp.]
MDKLRTAIIVSFLAVALMGFTVINSSESIATSDNNILLSCTHGHVIEVTSGQEYEGGVFSNELSLLFVPDPGYEFVKWNVVGDCVYSSNRTAITVSSVNGQVTISSECRNYSTSVYLTKHIVEEDVIMPGESMIMNWTFRSTDLVKSGGTWLGMPCTPLIVGDVVYVRAGDFLYALDINSGAIIKSVKSIGLAADFYHYISYGNGVIFDTTGYKAYDLDLNYLYDIPSNLRYVTYYDGYYYGCLSMGTQGYQLFKTSTAIDSDLENNVKTNLFTNTTTFRLFAQYGQVSSLNFIGDWVFFLEADSSDMTVNGYRGIVAFNLKTESFERADLTPGIGGMMWDDGWLTYYNGYFYVPTYVAGLFGGVQKGFEDRFCEISWVKFDFTTGQFGEIHYKDIETPSGSKFKGIVSELIIDQGHGYLNARALGTETTDGGVNDEGTSLISFDIAEDGEPIPNSVAVSFMTHGGIVMNTAFKDDGKVYIYLVPYNAGTQGVYVFTDTNDGEKWTLEPSSYRLKADANRQTYSSQAVRVGPDGQFVYYVDSGYIDCYISDTKLKTTFLLMNGDDLDAIDAYGSSWYSCLSSAFPTSVIDGDTVTIGEKNYKVLGLNEIRKSWETISNQNTVTYTTQHKDNAILTSYYRYVILLEENTQQRTSLSYNSGDKGWYYFDDGAYHKITMYLPESLDNLVGKQATYSTVPISADEVFVSSYLALQYDVPKTINLPQGSSVIISDESVVQWNVTEGKLTLTGKTEATCVVTISVGGKDYPIEIEVLPNVTIDEQGNRVVHSNKVISSDDGSSTQIIEDTVSNDSGSTIERTEVGKDANGNTVFTREITTLSKTEDYDALDNNGNPTSTTRKETKEYDSESILVTNTVAFTMSSTYWNGEMALTTFEVRSDLDLMSGVNTVKTEITTTYVSFVQHDVTVERYSGDTLESSESTSEIVSKNEELVLQIDGDSIHIAVSDHEPNDFGSLLSSIQSNLGLSTVIVRSECSLSSAAIDNLSDIKATLVMGAGSVELQLSPDALENLAAVNGDLELSSSETPKMTPKQTSAAGTAKVFSIELKCGNEQQHDFGTFTLSIACTIEIQDGKELKAWRIDDYGKKTYATNVSYQDGVVSFDADHLSIYAIGYESESSGDSSDGGNNGGNNGMFLYAGIGAIAVLALLGAVFVMRRRA